MNLQWLNWMIELPFIASVLLKMTLFLSLAWVLRFALWQANPRWRVLLWRRVAVGLVRFPFWRRLCPRGRSPWPGLDQEQLPGFLRPVWHSNRRLHEKFLPLPPFPRLRFLLPHLPQERMSQPPILSQHGPEWLHQQRPLRNRLIPFCPG